MASTDRSLRLGAPRAPAMEGGEDEVDRYPDPLPQTSERGGPWDEKVGWKVVVDDKSMGERYDDDEHPELAGDAKGDEMLGVGVNQRRGGPSNQHPACLLRLGSQQLQPSLKGASTPTKTTQHPL